MVMTRMQDSLPMSLDAIAGILAQGGLAVYPTETLYAVGCRADCAEAVEAVAALKARPRNKPLPLLVGGMAGLDAVCDGVSGTAEALMRSFWPGPLSVLVAARNSLAPGVSDHRGRTSVRWTAHPVAARLSELTGAPLVATSANVSGEPAAAMPEALSPAIVKGVQGAFLGKPYPGGGEPSTVVEVLDDGLRIIRHGAISPATLKRAGFIVL